MIHVGCFGLVSGLEIVPPHLSRVSKVQDLAKDPEAGTLAALGGSCEVQTGRNLTAAALLLLIFIIWAPLPGRQALLSLDLDLEMAETP